jgi:hypothetical protein
MFSYEVKTRPIYGMGNVPVSYIKCMSPCSACGFSTKKKSKVNTILKVVIFNHSDLDVV